MKTRLSNLIPLFSVALLLSPLLAMAQANCNGTLPSDYMPYFDSDPNFQLEQLEVRLLIHVIAKSDKTGNWPHSNQTQTNDSKSKIQGIIGRANYQLAHIAAPKYFDNGQQVTGIPHISDAKIEWVLDNADIIFHDDDDLFEFAKDHYQDLELYDLLATKSETHGNIFFIEEADAGGITGVGHGPIGSMVDVFIPILGTYSSYTNWYLPSNYDGYYYVWGNNLNHELCHSMAGMGHTFSSETVGIFPELPRPDGQLKQDPSTTYQHLSNNLMGASKQQDYLSPDQIKFWHQGIMSRACRQFVQNLDGLDPEDYAYNITTNTTWDNLAIINNDICIKSGATLTLKGCVEMGRDAVINVEQGGMLLLDGGSIKRAGTMGVWAGIKVWGDQSKSQDIDPEYFGQVRSTNNGGYISGAESAISTSKLDYGNVIDWSLTGGGIIKCQKCTFENNIRDVEFLKYVYIHPVTHKAYKNLSYFNECSFLTTSELPFLDPYVVSTGKLRKYEPHVTLWAVYGVRFSRCSFINSRLYDNGEYYNGQPKSNNFKFYVNNELFEEGEFNPSEWIPRIGIGTHSAYIELRGTLDDPECMGTSCPKTGNYFYGLGKGIVLRGIDRAYEGIALQDNNIFENCNVGIDFRSSANDLVVNNSFKHYMNFSSIFFESGTSKQGQGINLYASSGFLIQDNRFRSYIPLYEQEVKPRGIYSEGTLAGYAGLSHMNTFRDNWPAVKIEFDNPGHRITCNTYINQGYPDIPNTDFELNFEHSGNSGPMGLCDADVGWIPQNHFQENCNSDKDHIRSDKGHIRGNSMDYWYHTSEPAATRPQQSCITPHPVGGPYINVKSCTAFTPEACELLEQKDNWKYYDESDDYDGFINAAMTELEEGDNSTIKGKLINVAVDNTEIMTDVDLLRPYLSDEVLILMIERQPALPESYLKTVLVEHSALSDAVLSALDVNPLGNEAMNEIDAAQDNYSSVHFMRDYLDAALWNKMRVVYGFEQQLRDTVNNDTLDLDTLLNFYSMLQGQVYQGHRISALIDMGHITTANTLLAALNLSEEEDLQLYNFESLHRDLADDSRNWFEVTSNELSTLWDIAGTETRAAGFAENVLHLIGLIPDEFEWLDGNAQSSYFAESGIETITEQAPVFSVYPNPANDLLYIAFNKELQPTEAVNGLLTSFNGQCSTLVLQPEQRALNIAELPNGIYQLSILVEGTYHHQRFVKL